MQVLPKGQSPGRPTMRRYSSEEMAAAVRMVRTLREELGTGQGTVMWVAHQLGYGVESVRSWVRSSPRFAAGSALLRSALSPIRRHRWGQLTAATRHQRQNQCGAAPVLSGRHRPLTMA